MLQTLLWGLWKDVQAHLRTVWLKLLLQSTELFTASSCCPQRTHHPYWAWQSSAVEDNGLIFPRKDPRMEMSSHPTTDLSGVLQLHCLGLLCSRDFQYSVPLKKLWKYLLAIENFFLTVSKQIMRKWVLNDEYKTELLKSVNKRGKNCRAGACFEIPLKPQGAASIYSTTGNEVTRCQNSDSAEKYAI